MLTDTQIERYSRQIILPEVGGRGQEKLLAAAVAVVGAADCTTAAALYLVAAGIGRLTIVDVGDAPGGAIESPPTSSAEFEALNPDCHINRLSSPLTSGDAIEVVRIHAVVVLADRQETGTTDPTARLNAACVALRRPLVWGHIVGSVSRVTTLAGDSRMAPCYQCLLPQLPNVPGGAELPAWLSPATADFLGTVQATECIKLLLDRDSTLAGRLVTCDWLDAVVRETRVAKDPRCATCSADLT